MGGAGLRTRAMLALHEVWRDFHQTGIVVWNQLLAVAEFIWQGCDGESGSGTGAIRVAVHKANF